MTSEIFVIPTYEKSKGWEKLDPNREVPTMCDVRCIQDGGVKQFTNSLKLAKITSKYEAYDCYCVRKHSAAQEMSEHVEDYQFLIKEHLIINQDSTNKCTLDVPKEVVLGLGKGDEKKRMIKYRGGNSSDCQSVICQPDSAEEDLVLAYHWSKEDSTGYINGSYDMPEFMTIWHCFGIPVAVYQYGK
ncbi:hypothetical protein AAHC03_02060 [Spirometra sp. Aus1]